MHCRHQRKPVWGKWLLTLSGLAALVWFLVRVVPKTSRAAYPCQRMAAPIAGGFILWLVGSVVSMAAFRRTTRLLKDSRRRLACACALFALTVGITGFLMLPADPALADSPEPNAPIGVAKGINPGRVVWTHNPEATDWAGPGQGHWWEPSHTDQAQVDRMMSGSLQALTGERSDAAAWRAIFRHFNKTRNGTDRSYTAGEKIAVKVNLVGCIVTRAGSVDPESYEMTKALDYMNTSPQMMSALLRQLVSAAGVKQSDIAIGDPLSRFPAQYYEMLRRDFPDVQYMDHDGGTPSQPRRGVRPSPVAFYWSSRPSGTTQDYIPDVYAEATYFINLANLKSHVSAGVTLCAKNHFGSLARTPVEKGYFNMHDSLARTTPGYGHYRDLVDLTGHAHIGGKAVLYLIDGLYAGVHPIESSPKKWNRAPFGGDWSSSLLVSQDPVAIDSVAFDLLWAEWNDYPHMSGADDYLHEAALADNPPSGTFYDPDHPTPTVRLASLGVHEHWNDPEDMQYSRNLGTGKGIELVRR
ncbi:MAG: DUF362 domain-containing protein [Acidobacteria bacterium]|nr:DUF362 domain-containing protein [Acidobacteriota bacterium]